MSNKLLRTSFILLAISFVLMGIAWYLQYQAWKMCESNTLDLNNREDVIEIKKMLGVPLSPCEQIEICHPRELCEEICNGFN